MSLDFNIVIEILESARNGRRKVNTDIQITGKIMSGTVSQWYCA